MDLAEWVAAHRWRALLELIDQLPPASRYRGAFLNNKEAAEALAQAADSEKPTEPWSPPIEEWDLTNQLLHDLTSGVRILIAATQSAAAHKNIKPAAAFPTPRTEVDRARERLEQAAVQYTASVFGFSPDDF